jgi:hypothetical protein
MLSNLKCLLDSAKAFDRDDRLNSLLQASGLPIKARALTDVEVCDLYIPPGICVFTGDEARERTLAHAPFLAAHADD